MRTKVAAFLFLIVLTYTAGTCEASPSQPTPVRQADAACAKCHAAIYKSYLATPMANASGLATDQLRTATFVHPASHTEYSVSSHGNEAVLTYRSLEHPDHAGTWPLQYFLGSGHLGTTYLYSIGDYLFESPVAWYAASQHYDMKPGLAEMDHVPPPLAMQSGCMRCHMSAVQASDPGTMNRFSGLPFLHAGITCEACHGDSEAHVNGAGKSPIVNPAHLNADARDSICISCHLEGDISIERAGHSALRYQPGESISTYLAFYVRTGADLTQRGVSEVEQFARSTCRRMSGDKMSCTSCHDPHASPDAAHRIAFYRAKCLACHNQTNFAATHHPENSDCTACHMPRAKAANILHVAWTDHRILRDPGTAPPLAAATQNSGRLVPIFSPLATPRDQAMADYQALLEGDRSLEATAWKELSQLKTQISDDKDALDALGNLSAERGDADAAQAAFRRVLAIDPLDLTAKSNLGILLARQGKLSESLAMLRSAFQHNEDVPGLAMNLARVECVAGEAKSAQATLATALFYAPTAEDLQKLQKQLAHCAGDTTK
jgi:predicted CXXCH cytochrome family protein